MSNEKKIISAVIVLIRSVSLIFQGLGVCLIINGVIRPEFANSPQGPLVLIFLAAPGFILGLLACVLNKITHVKGFFDLWFTVHASIFCVSFVLTIFWILK
jgi:hypothetical protein